jgi:hypothetical protein
MLVVETISLKKETKELDKIFEKSPVLILFDISKIDYKFDCFI